MTPSSAGRPFKRPSSWTQSVCRPCWHAEAGMTEPRAVLRAADLERCCLCGNSTRDGIYIRADPATVTYPRLGALVTGDAA